MTGSILPPFAAACCWSATPRRSAATPYQYEGLEKLHAAGQPRGLTVIGVPSQDFNQESADNATVKTSARPPSASPSRWPASPTCADPKRRVLAWVREQRDWEASGISARC